ncbi:hypothetical protein MBSD_n0934 [Mizugakiibacter sediminis]|uniref:Uncharacterized protein n=2 Tax=Mizugakiibacter sediminis TaxID=1475481 RepID=A0A0K8QLC5_9GAMM|nr:EamA family transporter [Mizugakiibacter sediminis]GAP65644.1 hypothetical protein MBSD_n0934 [Mizugakiibacter sediminis]
MDALMGYFLILLTVLLTVYGQIVIKWQVNLAGALPAQFSERTLFLLKLIVNPWILSALAAAFLASIAWMAAMTRFELSKAYPFMALNFVLVGILAVHLFGETVNPAKIVGLVLVIAGLIVSSQG